jgi:hypothetical protein
VMLRVSATAMNSCKSTRSKRMRTSNPHGEEREARLEP